MKLDDLLEENISRTLQDIGVEMGILTRTPSAYGPRPITNKWDFIKLNKFLHS